MEKSNPKYTKYEWKKRVEVEFQTPIRPLIQSFIDDKYSAVLTAGALGIDVGTLNRYCKPRNIHFPARIDLRDECKPKPAKKGIIRNPWGCRGKNSVKYIESVMMI